MGVSPGELAWPHQVQSGDCTSTGDALGPPGEMFVLCFPGAVIQSDGCLQLNVLCSSEMKKCSLSLECKAALLSPLSWQSCFLVSPLPAHGVCPLLGDAFKGTGAGCEFLEVLVVIGCLCSCSRSHLVVP